MKQSEFIKRLRCKLFGGCVFREPLEYKVEDGMYKTSYICLRCGKKHSFEVPYNNLMAYGLNMNRKAKI